MNKGAIFLCAGGTGGHLFPAEALAHELNYRGWTIYLLTDSRAKRFTTSFPADEIHIIRAATFTSINPLAIIRTLAAIFAGYKQTRELVVDHNPSVMVGFGGYPTIPPLLAANRGGVPIVLQEQNAVLGRANRMFANSATAVATGFPLIGKDSTLGEKTVVTGNPLRPPVLEAAKNHYRPPKDGEPFNLVVFGGSQGARFFSQVLPKALEAMPPPLRNRLHITQQARPEDADELKQAFADLDIQADVLPFFDDMPQRIADAHLVICRAGASTVSELTTIGRPSILIPYPFALDHDQAANAAELAAKGGATIVPQSELDGEKLAQLMIEAINQPQLLAKAADNAKQTGIPDAALRLADVVERVAMSDAN